MSLMFFNGHLTHNGIYSHTKQNLYYESQNNNGKLIISTHKSINRYMRIARGTTTNAGNAAELSQSKKSSLSYSFYYQLTASEIPVKINSATPEISQNKRTDRPTNSKKLNKYVIAICTVYTYMCSYLRQFILKLQTDSLILFIYSFGMCIVCTYAVIKKGLF